MRHFRNIPVAPVVPVVKNNTGWSTKLVCKVPGFVLSPIPWFCLGNHTTASPPGYPHQEGEDEPVGLLRNSLTYLASKGAPAFAQGISTGLSATAVCQIPTSELYLKLCPLLSRGRPWAEQLLSFASRACSLGRDFVRLYNSHGPWEIRGKRSKTWTLSLGKDLVTHL